MTDGLAAAVDAAVRAVCPIVGVTIGAEADRATWTVVFDPAATAPQRSAAAAVISAFDVSTVATRNVSQDADADVAQKAVAAMVAYIYRVTHGGVNPTGAQLLAELAVWKAIFKALP